MVILKQIKKENNIISVIYVPDVDNDDKGTIQYDIELDEVIHFVYCKTDERSYLQSYFHKAVKAIREMIKKNEFPEEYIYSWY